MLTNVPHNRKTLSGVPVDCWGWSIIKFWQILLLLIELSDSSNFFDFTDDEGNIGDDFGTDSEACI